jgi:phosphoadenosine phosphosulfate reductase
MAQDDMAQDKDKVWTPEELAVVDAELESKSPKEVIRWVIDNFAVEDFALACSFKELALLDMLLKEKPDARIFYIDTGFHFKETLELKSKIEELYGITVERRVPEVSLEDMEKIGGPKLWETDPDKCCTIRKVEPLRKVLSALKLWMTGIRRDQGPTRAGISIVSWDVKFGLVKISPLATWTKKEVWDYIVEHDLPYNKLLDNGYPSIGCEPCTHPVVDGEEDDRSGRWSGHKKTECGLH